MAKDMVLRGFSGRTGDLRGRMRFCHPVLSPIGDGEDLFVATDIQWRPDGTGLKSVNRDEIGSFGTLWHESRSTTGPGIGVALVGSEFMREVLAALGGVEAARPFERDDELGCWTATFRRAEFDEFAKHLAASARDVFDRELRMSASKGGKLSRAGTAALFVLRRTPGRRDTDVAIRELMAANLQGEHDLYRRLLIVLSVKLGVSEVVLDRGAKRHLESIRSAAFVRGLDLQGGLLTLPEKSVQFESDYPIWVQRPSSLPHGRPLELGYSHQAQIEQSTKGFGRRVYGRGLQQQPITARPVAAG